MPHAVSPYNEGWRLEPKPWVKNGIAGQENPRPATGDDYGRVDFDNEAGETVVTVWIQKTEAGYILRAEELQDIELAIETGSDRQLRETAMMKLDADLRVAVAGYSEYVSLGEHDPETFGEAHVSIDSDDGRHRFLITENYVGTDWSDHERVPNSWTYEIEKADTWGINGGVWKTVTTKEVGPDDVDQLLDDAKSWLQSLPAPQEVEWDEKFPFRHEQVKGINQAPPAPTM